MKKILLLTFLLCTICSSVFAANWKQAATTNNCAFFFDTSQVKYGKLYNKDGIRYMVDMNNIFVWTKTVYSREEVAEMTSNSNSKFSNMSYCLMYDKFNTKYKTFQVLAVRIYDVNNNLIYSDDIPRDSKIIIPKSANENIYYDLLNYCLKNDIQVKYNTIHSR